MINRQGQILSAGYDLFGLPTENRVAAFRDGMLGFLDYRGKVRIPFIFQDGIEVFHSGLANVQRSERWGYIDLVGNVVIDFQFDEATPFNAAGLAFARVGLQSGFIDRSGAFRVLLPNFESGQFVDDETARLTSAEGDWAYVDKAGKVIWGPTKEMPDHAPLLGWDDGDKRASCEGSPGEVVESVRAFTESE